MDTNTNRSEIDQFLTVHEAAQLLGMTYKTTHRHVVMGNLKSVKKGGRYLIPRREIDSFRRSLAGRPRTSTPKWRISPEGNEQIGTSVEVRLREGVSEQSFARVLEKIKQSESYLFEGTIARYILSPAQDSTRVQILLIWRETVMPSPEAIAQALDALGKVLNDVLAWETATISSQRIWLHT